MPFPLKLSVGDISETDVVEIRSPDFQSYGIFYSGELGEVAFQGFVEYHLLCSYVWYQEHQNNNGKS